ncbi:MAG: methyltransferase domain-containing protein [Euryarchaeota archaeon]|nr:methyltransferase domain-containing protein [Euryarchaeota archaeon]
MKVAEVVQEYWGGRAAQMYDSISYIDREKMGHTLRNHLNVDKDGVILDFGTGPGTLALILAELGYKRIIGLDINRDMLGVAREKLSGHPVRLVRGDGLHLPIDDGSVDAVVSKWVLWVMPDPERAIEEMIRVTKPGGQILTFSSGSFSGEKDKSLLDRVSGFPMRQLHLIYTTLRFRLPLNRTKRFWEETDGNLPMHSLEAYLQIFREKGLGSVEMTENEEYGTLRAKLFSGGYKFSLIGGTKPGRSDNGDSFSGNGEWGLDELLTILVCPVCRTRIKRASENELICEECGQAYPIVREIPDLLPPEDKLL